MGELRFICGRGAFQSLRDGEIRPSRGRSHSSHCVTAAGAQTVIESVVKRNPHRDEFTVTCVGTVQSLLIRKPRRQLPRARGHCRTGVDRPPEGFFRAAEHSVDLRGGSRRRQDE